MVNLLLELLRANLAQGKDLVPLLSLLANQATQDSDQASIDYVRLSICLWVIGIIKSQLYPKLSP